MAVQEDVDVIGVSMLSGGHYAALSGIMSLLSEQDADDILVVAGGFLPDREEVAAIKAVGVRAVFDTDTRIDDVTTFLQEAVRERRAGLGTQAAVAPRTSEGAA
jgi:methylmalonyl-CoA mutase C-terminal domain/subunit